MLHCLSASLQFPSLHKLRVLYNCNNDATLMTKSETKRGTHSFSVSYAVHHKTCQLIIRISCLGFIVSALYLFIIIPYVLKILQVIAF